MDNVVIEFYSENYYSVNNCFNNNINYTLNNSLNNSANNSLNSIDFYNNDLIYLIIKDIITFLLIFGTTFTIASFAAGFMLINMKKEFEVYYNKNKNFLESHLLLFDYIDEYNLLEKKDLTQDSLKLLNIKFLKYYIHDEAIIMNYDNNSEAFNYYFKKTSNISFDLLDVISRIYVVKYDCKTIYTNNFDNINFSNFVYSSTNNDSENDSKNDVNCEKSVFYASKNSNSSKNSVKNTQYYSNKYKYKGSIDDFYNKTEKYAFKSS